MNPLLTFYLDSDMATFHYQFSVAAPRKAVNEFHRDSAVLKRLSPPPIFVQLHLMEPLANGALTEMTLWVGPIPLRWHARHEEVSEHGFTDVQEVGPMAVWRHQHHFQAAGANQTRVTEQIQYEHPAGLRGIFTRLLFNPASLYLLFTYRQMVTRLSLRQPVSATAEA